MLAFAPLVGRGSAEAGGTDVAAAGEEARDVEWSGEFEAGLNGSEGNSPQSKARVATRAERKSRSRVVALRASYSRASDDGNLSESRAFGEGRHDWLFSESRWQAYADGSIEFDEFKDYDLRATTGGGAAYRFIDDERTQLLGSAGFGIAREIGGSDNGITPEGVLELQLDHHLTQRQTLTSALTFFPDFHEPGEFRAVGSVQWDLVVEEGHPFKIRFGIEDRYDSTPEGFKPNDLDYYASLVWGF